MSDNALPPARTARPILRGAFGSFSQGMPFFILDNSLRLGAPRSLAFVQSGIAIALTLAGCGDGTSPSVSANAPPVADAGADQRDDADATVRSTVTQPTYTDGPQLPANTAVTTPWHLLNVRVTFDRAPETFESFCIRFRIEGDVGENVNLYFSPFNSTINQLPFYGGVQTAITGLDADGYRSAGGRGAIFSRWRERDTAAIERAPGGLIESSGHEGDFIGVRNSFDWDEGRYRLCLRKSLCVDGEPLPAGFDADDGALTMELGRFRGRYGRVTWPVLPALSIIESASLVSVDGNRFSRAIWDGRALRAGELPAGRINLRAELTDPSVVESVRLKLEGPVALERLRSLDVSSNQVDTLAALTHLDAGSNRIADLRPLTGSVRLQRLELDNNRIVDIRPLAGLTGLSRLSIGFNWIADLSAINPLVADGLQVVGRGKQSRAPAWSGAKPPPSGSRPFAECSQ